VTVTVTVTVTVLICTTHARALLVSHRSDVQSVTRPAVAVAVSDLSRIRPLQNLGKLGLSPAEVPLL